jgi:hypothetical protein
MSLHTEKMRCNERKHVYVIICQYFTLPNCCAGYYLIANSVEGIIILQVLCRSQNTCILPCFVPKTAGWTTDIVFVFPAGAPLPIPKQKEPHLFKYSTVVKFKSHLNTVINQIY